MKSLATCVAGAILTLIVATGCGSSGDNSSGTGASSGNTAVSGAPQPASPLASAASASAPTSEPTAHTTPVLDKIFYPEASNVSGVISRQENDAAGEKGDTLVCNPTSYLPVELNLHNGTVTAYGIPIRTSQASQGDSMLTTISAIGPTSPHAVIVNGNQAAPVLPEGTSTVTDRLLIKLDSKDWGPINKITICASAQ